MDDLQVYDRISDAVGVTPMIRLARSVRGLGCEVLAKIEFLNPMGSVKDRIARHMVERRMAAGGLAAGDTVVENSSGNTAMGLAMMSVLANLRCVMVVRRQTSKEKLDCLRAMGVELVLVDGSLKRKLLSFILRRTRRGCASWKGHGGSAPWLPERTLIFSAPLMSSTSCSDVMCFPA